MNRVFIRQHSDLDLIGSKLRSVLFNNDISTSSNVSTLAGASQFLYLTTVGWKSGSKHTIEIWYVEFDGRYYILSERGTSAHWVQNIAHDPGVVFNVSTKGFAGRARLVFPDKEPDLARAVSGLMKEKYGWGDGLIVELTPGS